MFGFAPLAADVDITDITTPNRSSADAIISKICS
jgi:hypothetical protein